MTKAELQDLASQLNFSELFDEYYPKLYRYVRYRVSSRDEAEDLTAQAFERAFKNRDRFDPKKGAFSTWLFTIARNIIINHQTQTARRGPVVDLEEIANLPLGASSPEGAVMQQENIQKMLQQLSILSERDQDIIAMKFGSRMRNKDIAEALDLKEKAVSVILLRALRKLKQKLQEEPL